MRSLNDLKVLPWIALAALLVAVVVVLSPHGAVYARMQEPDLAATIPVDYAEFQYATLTGTTNTINATMVPVVVGSNTTYKDITIPVTVSANGTLTLGTPTVVNSPVIQIANFKAGTYVGPSNIFGGKASVTVSGPGVAAGGATEWSLAAAPGADGCTYPASATWYVGSPTSTSNPLYARLKKAGITSTAYSYGVEGNGGCGPANYWDAGSLLGLSQSGKAITIYTFSQFSTNDYNSPKDQITYTWTKP